MKRGPPKFAEGDVVVFKRETWEPWEAGTYLAPHRMLGERAWHRVRASSSSATVLVPMNRLRLAEGDPRPR